jgi:hypothetical protein
MLLNLMPCVFPVLSIKAMSFVAAHGSATANRLHGRFLYYMKIDSFGQLHTSATCRQRLVRQSKFQILEVINPLQTT